MIHYLPLVLKNLEKSVILKEVRPWTSEVSINTENMFSPEKALSFYVLLDPYRYLQKNTVWAKVRSIYIDFLWSNCILSSCSSCNEEVGSKDFGNEAELGWSLDAITYPLAVRLWGIHFASLRIAQKLHSIFTKLNCDSVQNIYYLVLLMCALILNIGNPHCTNVIPYLLESLFGVGEALGLCWAVYPRGWAVSCSGTGTPWAASCMPRILIPKSTKAKGLEQCTIQRSHVLANGLHRTICFQHISFPNTFRQPNIEQVGFPEHTLTADGGRWFKSTLKSFPSLFLDSR